MSTLKSKTGAIKAKAKCFFWNGINRFGILCQGVRVGRGLQTCGRIRIRNRGNMEIGDRVTVNSSIMSNPLGGNSCTILVATEGAKIQIGNGSGLSNVAVFSRERVTIGEDVFIGAGVYIYDNDFHAVPFEERVRHEAPACEPITICDGAFIGAHSIILKGVTVGKHSVIGAGSVVTKSVPDGEIWAGNPAKPIKKLEETE